MSPNPAGFERLLRRACRLEADALEELIALYSPRVYGLLMRMTGSREEAEDLLQETFLRVVRMISEYQHDGRFDAWLFRIAANLARDHLRRVRRRGVASRFDQTDGDAAGVVREPADDRQARPEAAALATEARERVQAALSDLPEAEREIILLRHFAELPFREIAELLGVPLGTALARAHRALKKLRDLMGNE
jgi:RNA polymerase sigma-70 factor, ECF subfamily